MNYKKVLNGIILIAFSFILYACIGVSKDQDGNTLKIMRIKDQIWMAGNLDVSHFRNGDEITEVQTPEEWVKLGYEGKPAWCNIPDGDTTNKSGKLYNWYAVNDPRGLAPKGWHVATDDEWEEMIGFLGGGVLAAMTLTDSLSNNKTDNTYGFSGFPAGGRDLNGQFKGYGILSMWWTSTEATESNSWMRLLNHNQCNIYLVNTSKAFGLSVRCIKD
jgi:uncharacterized protein (TIGR02145 family)